MSIRGDFENILNFDNVDLSGTLYTQLDNIPETFSLDEQPEFNTIQLAISAEQDKRLEARARIYLERLRLERLTEARSLAKETQLKLLYRRRSMEMRKKRTEVSAHDGQSLARGAEVVDTK
jgi:hypothetical protein